METPATTTMSIASANRAAENYGGNVTPSPTNNTTDPSPKMNNSTFNPNECSVANASEESTLEIYQQRQPSPSSFFGAEWVRNPDGTPLLDHNNKPIPIAKLLGTKPLRGELQTRPGPGNKKLLYLSGDSVTRTLNDVFGFDGWCLEVKDKTREECVKDSKDRFHVAYTATVRVTHRRSGAFKEDCGAGDSIDRSLGTAVAHALKGAVTDALKRAVRHFGDKLGNSLYESSFNVNKAPRTLKDALNAYDIERANTKFGFEKDRYKTQASGQQSAAQIKTEIQQPSNMSISKQSPVPLRQTTAAIQNTTQQDARNVVPKLSPAPIGMNQPSSSSISISNNLCTPRNLNNAPFQSTMNGNPSKNMNMSESSRPAFNADKNTNSTAANINLSETLNLNNTTTSTRVSEGLARFRKSPCIGNKNDQQAQTSQQINNSNTVVGNIYQKQAPQSNSQSTSRSGANNNLQVKRNNSYAAHQSMSLSSSSSMSISSSNESQPVFSAAIKENCKSSSLPSDMRPGTSRGSKPSIPVNSYSGAQINTNALLGHQQQQNHQLAVENRSISEVSRPDASLASNSSTTTNLYLNAQSNANNAQLQNRQNQQKLGEKRGLPPEGGPATKRINPYQMGRK